MQTFIRSVALCGMAAACAPALPDSNPDYAARQVDIGQGVGLGDYEAYEAARLQRERELRGVQAAAAPAATGAAGSGPVISSDELRSAGLPAGGTGSVLPAAEPVATAPLGSVSAPPPTVAAGPVGSNPGISDEQSFEAVASRETIESDAERLARQRAAYQQIQPEAVPQRSGTDRPNIVQYALTTTNALGQPVYRRGGLFQERKFRRACLKFPSSDLAQEAFLADGGPETDRLGVDPDGDGFACAWDPAPFRAAQG